MLKRKIDNPDLVADLTQQTLLTVIENGRQDKIREPERLVSYVYGVADRLRAQHFSTRSRQKTDSGTERVERSVSDYLSPLVTLNREQIRTALRDLVEKLNSPRDRDILLRHHVHRVSIEASCEHFEITRDHYYRVLHRARRRLRRLVEKRFGIRADLAVVDTLLGIAFVVGLGVTAVDQHERFTSFTTQVGWVAASPLATMA